MGSISKKKLDTVATGIIIGFVAPLIVFLISYNEKVQVLIKIDQVLGNSELNFNYLSRILPSIIKVCLFSNALVFFIFFWLHMNKSAKGILIFSAIALVLLVAFRYLPGYLN
ncbi:MAG: hypothetical protein MI922_24275 [Bacteroidales bacterium]|nr:hypothetical protein [Bacteroidales bacterium]